MQRFASVILVDPRGWVLLQERDEHPVIDPETWGLVGGHVEPDEDYETAAYRELAEETGVHLAGGLRRWRRFEVFHHAYGTTDEVEVWAAATRLGDGDITCHEGRRIIFVAPDRARGLDLTTAARIALPAFLGSPTHERLTTEAAGGAGGVDRGG